MEMAKSERRDGRVLDCQSHDKVVSRCSLAFQAVTNREVTHRESGSTLTKSRLRVHMVSNPCSALEFTSLGRR